MTQAFIPFNIEAVEQSIGARFEQQAAVHANRPAVVSEAQSYTYAQLDALANRIAHTLLQQDLVHNAPVAILLGQEAFTIAAMIGVLKSGRFYLRLDPSWPAERIAQMLEVSAANVVLTVRSHWALAQSVAHAGQRVLDCAPQAIERDERNPGVAVAPTAPAFIIYTSGSTGQPKGVLHSHRNVLLEAMNYINPARLTAADRLSLCTSLSFAMATRNLYGALLNGSSVHPFDLSARGFGDLARSLDAYAITILCMPPTAFRSFCDTLAAQRRFEAVRILRIVGEQMSGEDVRRYRHHFSADCLLMHGLGPSESLTARITTTRLGSCDVRGKLSIGEPVPGKETLLLNDDGEPAAPGEVGEVVIRSRYLALGYWRRPDLTAAVFLPDPQGGEERLYRTGDLAMVRADGSMAHAGRRDFQVKVRGFRIELAEIEMRLRSLAAVKAAAVVAHKRDDGEQMLVAYVETAGERVTSATELRQALGRMLPDYMLPSVFVWMDALPTLANGKINRQGLPPPPPQRPALSTAFLAARTETEKLIARIWADVLGLDEVGVEDSFFELGGDSLLAARAIARLHDRSGVELPLRAFFDGPTVAAMAQEIDRARGTAHVAGTT